MIPFNDLKVFPLPGEIVYSWEDEDTQKIRMWAIGRMEKWLPTSGLDVVSALIDPDRAEWFIKNRGVEEHRLNWLAENPEICFNPCIMMRLERPDGKGFWDIMLDGHHRYVVLAAAEIPYFKFYHLNEKEASRFEVSDVPQPRPGGMNFLLDGFSGIVPPGSMK